jgi:hypothetical protein
LKTTRAELEKEKKEGRGLKGLVEARDAMMLAENEFKEVDVRLGKKNLEIDEVRKERELLKKEGELLRKERVRELLKKERELLRKERVRELLKKEGELLKKAQAEGK